MSFWSSPITTDLLVSGAVGISEVVADGLDVYWAENRPDEGGRAAIVRWSEGVTAEVTGPDVNVRTRVHEYGGGAWWVADGRLVFSDDVRDGDLFLLDVATGDERRLTSTGGRYADGRFTNDGVWFVCVREEHASDDPTGVENRIVAVNTDGSGERVVAEGHDFYGSPVIAPAEVAPDGTLAFIAWDNPNMPWDTTLLHVGTFDGESGSFGEVPTIDESMVLPGWTGDGRLLAVTDRSNWWNLVDVDPATGAQVPIVDGEFEIATPGWVFGLSRWCETSAGFVVVAGTPNGDTIGFPNGFVETRHTAVSSIRSLEDGRIAYAAASFAEEFAVWVHDGAEATRISTPRDLGLDVGFFTPPEHITFEVTDIDPDLAPGTVAHALVYAPANPSVTESETLPALLVLVHGGPTTAARRSLDLKIRFWTSRGVAVADVDYRGSTLYGRDFRNQLHTAWGHADVVDCVAAAHHLANAGMVDASRMVIAGGSAGGLTVLNALSHHDVFSGGIVRYGVADLAALVADTHKFEARYLDRLVGPLPEAADLYAARSPLNYVDKIAAPMLVLQGLDDKIVPPSQSEAIVAALEANDIPVTYIEFEGEGHGFRKSETIVAALEAELGFIGSL